MDSYNGKPNGPAISMSQADHKNTASFGRKAGSDQYRADQKHCLSKENFRKHLIWMLKTSQVSSLENMIVPLMKHKRI